MFIQRHAEALPGKVGKDSAAAKFHAATASDDFSIQEDKPYAEVLVTSTAPPSRLQC
jgi:hypothetical protein